MISALGLAISRFLASRAVTIALLAALAGGGAYMYFEIKEAGRLEARADELERTLAANEIERQRIQADSDRRNQALIQQRRQMAQIQSEYATKLAELRDAEAQAPQAFRDCMDMPVPDGMRLGTGLQD